MPEAQITNPANAFNPVTDYRTWIDAAGNLLSYPRRVDVFIAAGTITAKDWVGLVAPSSATTPLKIEQLDVSDAFAAFVCAGVALESGVAGDQIQVVTLGPAICNIGNTGTIAHGDSAIKHATTDGASGVTAVASVDATTVVGTILGIYLGAEIGTSDTAPVWVRTALS